MYVGTVTMKNSKEFSQKIMNRATIWPNNCTSGYLPEKLKHLNFFHKEIYTLTFIAVLFTVAKMETTEVSLIDDG